MQSDRPKKKVARINTQNLLNSIEKKSSTALPYKSDTKDDCNSDAGLSSRGSTSSNLPALGKGQNWRDFFNVKELQRI
jgi:hypothetical protein